jgi:molybdopterin converting factor small subunit
MGVVVVLPALLAREAGGRRRFELEAATVRDALAQLPVADLLFDEHGTLRPLVNVYVGSRDVRFEDGAATRLADGDTVRIVAAVAGGCSL